MLSQTSDTRHSDTHCIVVTRQIMTRRLSVLGSGARGSSGSILIHQQLQHQSDQYRDEHDTIRQLSRGYHFPPANKNISTLVIKEVSYQHFDSINTSAITLSKQFQSRINNSQCFTLINTLYNNQVSKIQSLYKLIVKLRLKLDTLKQLTKQEVHNNIQPSSAYIRTPPSWLHQQ